MSWPSVAPATDRSFRRRSPREKYVSTCRNVPTRSAPARRARAFPRSSYLALSSTRSFEPASTRGETMRTTRSLPCAQVGGSTADSSGCDVLVDRKPARGFGTVERRFAASRCPFGWATASFSRSRWAFRLLFAARNARASASVGLAAAAFRLRAITIVRRTKIAIAAGITRPSRDCILPLAGFYKKVRFKLSHCDACETKTRTGRFPSWGRVRASGTRGFSPADDDPHEQGRERYAEACARREDLPREAFDLRAGRPKLGIVPDLRRLNLTDAGQERRVHRPKHGEEANEDGQARLEHELRGGKARGQEQHVQRRGPSDVRAELPEPRMDLQDVLLDRRDAPSRQ